MSLKNKKELIAILDKLALALTKHNHVWTKAERSGYNKAMSVLK